MKSTRKSRFYWQQVDFNAKLYRWAEPRSDKDTKAEETALFTKYYTEWKGGGARDQSYKSIPRFYYRVNTWRDNQSIWRPCNCSKETRTPNTNDDDVSLQLPAEDEVLLQKLREESRAVLLQRKSRELLDNEELQVNLKTTVMFSVI